MYRITTNREMTLGLIIPVIGPKGEIMRRAGGALP